MIHFILGPTVNIKGGLNAGTLLPKLTSCRILPGTNLKLEPSLCSVVVASDITHHGSLRRDRQSGGRGGCCLCMAVQLAQVIRGPGAAPVLYLAALAGLPLFPAQLITPIEHHGDVHLPRDEKVPAHKLISM